MIATGRRCPVISADERDAETDKRVTAALLQGRQIVCIDNVNGDLGTDLLCQAVERPLQGSELGLNGIYELRKS